MTYKIFKMIKYLSFTFITIFLFSCSSETQQEVVQETIIEEINPAAEGFDEANSDAKAIEIADAVMKNMGGRKAWDDLKIVSWNFFGARKLWWNKHSGDVRIEFPESDSNVLITNIFTHQGKIKLDGVEETHPDSIKKYGEMAESIWINDAYWLFMPFKLKDSKTTLKYLNIDTANGGIYSHILQLTFNEIGDTPENKYWVYIDTTAMLVNQWAYFGNASDSIPAFTSPWNNYQKYGDLLLAGDRGKNNITEITVLDSIGKEIFTEF
jgi:hypothetical protein